MNTKLYLMTVALAALLAGFLAFSALADSSTVASQKQIDASRSASAVNEPAVRMWSGLIQFSDSNSPDFRPHGPYVQPSAKDVLEPGCIADEQATPRRWGGCIQ